MKTQIQKMKLELKELAHQIRQTKKLRTAANNGYVSGLHEMRQAFRYKHLAYCLVRGRTLEQCDSGRGLDLKNVNWIIDSMKEDSKLKLYVVVNGKLTASQQAVQAGHAVAEFMRKYPNTQWSNGYLIYLREDSLYDGNVRPHPYLMYGLNQYAEFVEPDLDNKVTAYACFGPEVERVMKNKILL